jgi:hypothetical protein
VRENPNTILIIGATGGTSRQLVKQALELGHYVTALARKPVRQHPRPDGPARGKYRHGPNVGNFISTRISRANVADFMLRQLTDDEYLGTAVGVYW